MLHTSADSCSAQVSADDGWGCSVVWVPRRPRPPRVTRVPTTPASPAKRYVPGSSVRNWDSTTRRPQTATV
jgi:hypothetical protein